MQAVSQRREVRARLDALAGMVVTHPLNQYHDHLNDCEAQMTYPGRQRVKTARLKMRAPLCSASMISKRQPRA